MSNENNEKSIAVKRITKVLLIITNTFSILIPLVCFTVVPLFKSDWTLYIQQEDGTKELNDKFLFFLIVALVASVLFIVLNCYLSTKDYHILTLKTYNDLVKADADRQLYQEMVDKFNKLCDNKLSNLRKEIGKVCNGEKNHKGEVFPDPMIQMSSIFREHMCEFLTSFVGFDRGNSQNISVSVAYKINDSALSEWKWFEGCDPESGCTAQSLATNTKSAFYHLLKNTDRFIFYNSKKDASTKNIYIFNNANDVDDNNIKSDGSLIGRRITIGQSYAKPCAELVLFFSTKDVLFVNSKSADVKDMRNKLKNWFFRSFDKRISIEFSYYFLNNYPFDD